MPEPKLIPIDPNNDGGLLQKALSSYIYNFTHYNKKHMDISSSSCAVKIIVAFDKYLKEGVEVATKYLQDQTLKETQRK